MNAIDSTGAGKWDEPLVETGVWMLRLLSALALIFVWSPAVAVVTVGNDLVGTDSGSCLFQNGCPQLFGLAKHIGAENFSVGPAGATITGADFTSWVNTGAPNVASVDWYILADASGLPGTTIANQTAANPIDILLGPAPTSGSNLVETQFAIPSVPLTQGHYWIGFTLNLESDPIGTFYYWANTTQGDQKDAMFDGSTWGPGPGVGSPQTLHNEVFHITGVGDFSGTVPEISSWIMMLLGFLGLVTMAQWIVPTAKPEPLNPT